MSIKLCANGYDLQLCANGTDIKEACCVVCPCSDYAPASWPCNGMNQYYRVTGHLNVTSYTNNNCTGTPTVLSDADFSADVKWLAPCDWEKALNIGGFASRVIVGVASSNWFVYVYTIVGVTLTITAPKTDCTDSPIGAYIDTTSCNGAQKKITLSNVAVVAI